MNILVNAYEYGRYHIREIRGEEGYQIYKEIRGTASFTGIYTDTMEEAFKIILEIIKAKKECD